MHRLVRVHPPLDWVLLVDGFAEAALDGAEQTSSSSHRFIELEAVGSADMLARLVLLSHPKPDLVADHQSGPVWDLREIAKAVDGDVFGQFSRAECSADMSATKLDQNFERHDRDVAIVRLKDASLAEAGAHLAIVEVAIQAPFTNDTRRLGSLWYATQLTGAHCYNFADHGSSPWSCRVYLHSTLYM
jgi:hypothetical protein